MHLNMRKYVHVHLQNTCLGLKKFFFNCWVAVFLVQAMFPGVFPFHQLDNDTDKRIR